LFLELYLPPNFGNFHKNNLIGEKPKKPLVDFLSKPLIKTDSKFIQYSGLGVQLSGTILIFLFIGIWLDKHSKPSSFHTYNDICRIFGGFYSFYLTIKTSPKQRKKIKKKRIDKEFKQYSIC